MVNLLKNIVRFKLGKSAAKSSARLLGLRWLAVPLGLFAGYKAMRRN